MRIARIFEDLLVMLTAISKQHTLQTIFKRHIDEFNEILNVKLKR